MATARQIYWDTQIFVERVRTDINGRELRMLANPDRLAAGDQLIFVVNWRNISNQEVRGVAVTNSVPRGTHIAPHDPRMQLSVDGGRNWGRLDQIWLPTPLGGTRRAVAADVTHVRWALPSAISPGETGRLSYRATVR
ncbi:MAG: hypothetical protein AB7E60_12170 [Sphingobium sp.]